MIARRQQDVEQQEIGFDRAGRDQDVVGVAARVGGREHRPELFGPARFAVAKRQREQALEGRRARVDRLEIEQVVRRERQNPALGDVELDVRLVPRHPAFEEK